jgi:arylsulfatase A-like enzyme
MNPYRPRSGGVPPGWDAWFVAGDGYAGFNYDVNQNGQIRHFGKTADAYLTDVVAAFADSIIRLPGSTPFFVEVSTFAPHKPYTPAPRDQDKFDDVTLPRSATFGAHPGPSAPPWLQLTPPLRRVDVERMDRVFRLRVQSVQAIDRMIGQLRATITALGLERNTYFVFSSDNGLHLGDYSLRPGKMTPFDVDVHVPLIVVGPGVPRGVTLSQIVQNVDLAPSFAELAGALPPLTPDGRSFVPLLRSDAAASSDAGWRRAALIEHRHPTADSADPDLPELFSANPPSYVAMRTKTALYVEYEGGERSFYDLVHDPFELMNVAKVVSATTLRQLHDILQGMVACKGTQSCWNAQRGF